MLTAIDSQDERSGTGLLTARQSPRKVSSNRLKAVYLSAADLRQCRA